MPEPIRRHPSLQPFSRAHHDILMLCFKIRQGLKKGVSPSRIKAYMHWFYANQLEPHFKQEEDGVFPILGHEHPAIVKARAEHDKLRRAFRDALNDEEQILNTERTIEAHVRFEERELYNFIQHSASPDQLDALASIKSAPVSCEVWDDEFWR